MARANRAFLGRVVRWDVQVRDDRRVPWREACRLQADALVVGISVGWVLVSPMNFDDSWYPLMARDAAGTTGVGDVADPSGPHQRPEDERDRSDREIDV